MQAIIDWLNSGREYQAGVDLYMQHGRDQLLRKLFTAEGKTPFKEKKLIELLKGLLQRQQPMKTDLPTATTVHTRHVGWPSVPIEDDIVRALYLQWKPLYSEMLNLQSRIFDVAEAAEKYHDNLKKQQACDMAHRIADMDDEIDEIYFKRDFYLQHSRLPDQPLQTDVIAPTAWPKKLANAERYARDYKNKVTKDPGNEKHAAKLKFYQQEIMRYKKLLKLE